MDSWEDFNSNLAVELLGKGWILIDCSEFLETKADLEALSDWEIDFGAAFDLPSSEKEGSGMYRVEKGLSVGYRRDSEREFFETRMRTDGISEPSLSAQPRFSRKVNAMYGALRKVSTVIFSQIANLLKLDPKFFCDISDVASGSERTESQGEVNLSSSLLRICKYVEQPGTDIDVVGTRDVGIESAAEGRVGGEVSLNSEGRIRPIWFGSHTDSSLVTIGLVAASPGLDLVDQISNKWISPEYLVSVGAHRPFVSHFGPLRDSSVPTRSEGPFAVVFVGELLQILTKQQFKASVHRVRSFHNPSTSGVSSGGKAPPLVRLSCPFLVRGQQDAIIAIRDHTRYNHPGGDEALNEDKVPDLDGTSIKLVQKLLDLKRQKCFRDNGSAEGPGWVLSAYPAPPLPMDNNRLDDFKEF